MSSLWAKRLSSSSSSAAAAAAPPAPLPAVLPGGGGRSLPPDTSPCFFGRTRMLLQPNKPSSSAGEEQVQEAQPSTTRDC